MQMHNDYEEGRLFAQRQNSLFETLLLRLRAKLQGARTKSDISEIILADLNTLSKEFDYDDPFHLIKAKQAYDVCFAVSTLVWVACGIMLMGKIHPLLAGGIFTLTLCIQNIFQIGQMDKYAITGWGNSLVKLGVSSLLTILMGFAMGFFALNNPIPTRIWLGIAVAGVLFMSSIVIPFRRQKYLRYDKVIEIANAWEEYKMAVSGMLKAMGFNYEVLATEINGRTSPREQLPL
jgi:hypothetical protein